MGRGVVVWCLAVLCLLGARRSVSCERYPRSADSFLLDFLSDASFRHQYIVVSSFRCVSKKTLCSKARSGWFPSAANEDCFMVKFLPIFSCFFMIDHLSHRNINYMLPTI